MSHNHAHAAPLPRVPGLLLLRSVASRTPALLAQAPAPTGLPSSCSPSDGLPPLPVWRQRTSVRDVPGGTTPRELFFQIGGAPSSSFTSAAPRARLPRHGAPSICLFCWACPKINHTKTHRYTMITRLFDQRRVSCPLFFSFVSFSQLTLQP